jgi:hypothetical protein
LGEPFQTIQQHLRAGYSSTLPPLSPTVEPPKAKDVFNTVDNPSSKTVETYGQGPVVAAGTETEDSVSVDDAQQPELPVLASAASPDASAQIRANLKGKTKVTGIYYRGESDAYDASWFGANDDSQSVDIQSSMSLAALIAHDWKFAQALAGLADNDDYFVHRPVVISSRDAKTDNGSKIDHSANVDGGAVAAGSSLRRSEQPVVTSAVSTKVSAQTHGSLKGKAKVNDICYGAESGACNTLGLANSASVASSATVPTPVIADDANTEGLTNVDNGEVNATRAQLQGTVSEVVSAASGSVALVDSLGRTSLKRTSGDSGFEPDVDPMDRRPTKRWRIASEELNATSVSRTQLDAAASGSVASVDSLRRSSLKRTLGDSGFEDDLDPMDRRPTERRRVSYDEQSFPSESCTHLESSSRSCGQGRRESPLRRTRITTPYRHQNAPVVAALSPESASNTGTVASPLVDFWPAPLLSSFLLASPTNTPAARSESLRPAPSSPSPLASPSHRFIDVFRLNTFEMLPVPEVIADAMDDDIGVGADNADEYAVAADVQVVAASQEQAEGVARPAKKPRVKKNWTELFPPREHRDRVAKQGLNKAKKTITKRK